MVDFFFLSVPNSAFKTGVFLPWRYSLHRVGNPKGVRFKIRQAIHGWVVGFGQFNSTNLP